MNTVTARIRPIRPDLDVTEYDDTRITPTITTPTAAAQPFSVPVAIITEDHVDGFMAGVVTASVTLSFVACFTALIVRFAL